MRSSPVDLNHAAREAFLRVPELADKNVDRIVSIRRFHRLTLDHLRKLHVPVRRAQPFVMTPGFSHPLLRLDREDLPRV